MAFRIVCYRTILKHNIKFLSLRRMIPILRPISRKLSWSKKSLNQDNLDLKKINRFFKFWMKERIEILERTANENPHNPTAQYQFLESLIETDPDYVIKRVESGQYAVDDHVRDAYRQAITFKLDSSTPSKSKYFSSFLSRSAGPFKSLFKLLCFYILLKAYLNFAGIQIPKISFDISSIVGEKTEFNEVKPEDIKIRFSDVKGNLETKQELMEIVDFLKNPDKYKNIGCRISSGVLMVGAPGTGKTMLAKAIAGEAQVPFYYATGSEFDEMYVGVGALRIRKLFAKARANSPCIIFIDELDAVGSKRVDSPMAPYSRMTINQLLTEMDGFKDNNIVLIGATNDPKSINLSALIRAGRFDTHIEVPLPSFKDRVEILDYYVKKVARSPDVNIDRIAALTPGASGADLSNLVNQAAVRAVNRKSKVVAMVDIEWARDKILMGRERKSIIFTEDEKKRIADHEAGHAIVAYYTPGSRNLHKATIIPRGSALGVTHLLPERDEYLLSYKQLLASIDVSMGGRAAEELIYGSDQITTGCSSDLVNATNIAKKLISEYGYSQTFGLNSLENEITSSISPQLDLKVHDEVKKMLD
ncbi:hypothetical protein HZS_4703, partial [Henneguya salminicola]